MNLIEAFQEMAKGGKVRRKNDGDISHYLCFNKDGELVDETGTKKILVVTTVENVMLDSYVRVCDILSKNEKNLLSLLVKSKKSKALYIVKAVDEGNGGLTGKEKIIVLFDSKEDKYITMDFTEGTMFKELILGDKYTPDELGL